MFLIAEHSFNENDIVLVAVGRLYKETEISSLCLLEAKKEEYVTRHEPSGKMIYIDHRIAVVAGYFSEEVLGLSPFNFMHKDDVTWVMIALKQSEFFDISIHRSIDRSMDGSKGKKRARESERERDFKSFER